MTLVSSRGDAVVGGASADFVAELTTVLPVVVAAVVGDRARRDDVAQETAIRAWRGRSTFEQSRPLLPWLWSLAKASAAEVDRRERREQELAACLPHPHVDDAWSPGCDEHVVRLDRCGDVRRVLATLTPRDRKVLQQRHGPDGDVAYAVVASLNGTSEEAARQAVGRARRRFADAYAATTARGCFVGLAAAVCRWRARLARRGEALGERLVTMIGAPGAAIVAALVVPAGAAVWHSETSRMSHELVAARGTTSAPAPELQHAIAPPSPQPLTPEVRSTAAGPQPDDGEDVDSTPVPRLAAIDAHDSGFGVEHSSPDVVTYQGLEFHCDRSVVASTACTTLRAAPIERGRPDNQARVGRAVDYN